MTWPFALRSTVNNLRLLLASKAAENAEMRRALEASNAELRKHRLLLAGRYETISKLKERA